MIESLSYAQLGERLGVSAAAARALSRRLRLPRTTANDGKTLLQVDVSEISHSPKPAARSTRDEQTAVAVLTAKLEALAAELAKAEATVSFERERGADLLAQLLRATAELATAKAVADRSPVGRSRWFWLSRISKAA